jgi:hypothetical protein
LSAIRAGRFPHRHSTAHPPQRIHGAPKQRAALEPWVALVPPFRGYVLDVESGLQHEQRRFDLKYGRLEPDALALVLQEFPG